MEKKLNFDFDSLAQEANELANKNGFWDDTRYFKKIANSFAECNMADKTEEINVKIDNLVCVTKLALVTTEISEAVEAIRKNKRANLSLFNAIRNKEDGTIQNFMKIFEEHVKDTFEDELADAIIRIMDLAAEKKINLTEHIALKHTYNKLRPYKHNVNF